MRPPQVPSGSLQAVVWVHLPNQPALQPRVNLLHHEAVPYQPRSGEVAHNRSVYFTSQPSLMQKRPQLLLIDPVKYCVLYLQCQINLFRPVPKKSNTMSCLLSFWSKIWLLMRCRMTSVCVVHCDTTFAKNISDLFLSTIIQALVLPYAELFG